MSRAVVVEIVHLDDCPLWRTAAGRVRQAMNATGLDPDAVHYREVATSDAPVDFPGSPTILIDGRDPFRTDAPVGPTCRRYRTDEGFDVAPSLEELVEAITE